ncbi:MAG: potassium-transporting ATPase subunit KdpB [Pseudonocardia sp.]|nr:potassium-transporting ATPase subunit KdpB [Pseudonocardia sp.]
MPAALRKLDPRTQLRNPVMFVVWVGSVVVTVSAIVEPSVFAWLIAVWLWFTVLFANLAEAVAEGRGKAQADSLRRTKTDTMARRLGTDDAEEQVPGTELRIGDHVVVEAGETIPGDGDIVEGIATVDESAITGESAPVIREAGGDRSSVTGGTTVLSDRIVVQITTKPGESFVDRMIALVEGAARQKTPNEIALTILLATLTIIFLLAVVAVAPMSAYAGAQQSLVVLTALLVCLIPTTIGALLSAIGIAGMDRLVQRNVLATSGRAVEAAGDVDTLLLDKTGTITYGNRQATELIAVAGVVPAELATAARLSSLADQTPEGRSIVALCAAEHHLPGEATAEEAVAQFVPFTAQTRMSGIDLDGRQVRKGSAGAVAAWVAAGRHADTTEVDAITAEIAAQGGTPLVVAQRDDRRGARVLGVIRLSDVVKPGMAERFAELRAMGIRTVMITGDNPLTANAIATEAGVDDFLAEATPEDKMALIRKEQDGGRLVAMTGDGTNDAPALAQADVGVAMNTGTAAAKEAGNMVDLDSDPTKLINVVEIGKQLLITRGALTTFSIANDLAKYFAILPAMFLALYPSLGALNIMGLATPQSAILSAVIFNALIIVALIPLALRGVRYRPTTAAKLLRRNLLIYGLGGVVTPFAGIFLIDLLVRLIPGI